MRTREEHLEWCKARAREYLDRGDVANGITSMMSDLDKHPETKVASSVLVQLGMRAVIDHDLPAARRFVEGFL